MRHDELILLRSQLTEALQGDDSMELACIAGLLARLEPEAPELEVAFDTLRARPPELSAAAEEALLRVEEADEDDEPEETWSALSALDEVFAAATFLGGAAPLRPVAEAAARVIRAFPEPWRAHADAATALLGDQPPAVGDPSSIVWRAVEASRWELPSDPISERLTAQLRFVAGLGVSLGDWGSENPLRAAAAGPLRAEPPWTLIHRGEGWTLALTRDDDGAPAVVCSDSAATATVNGEPVLARPAYGGALFMAKAGSWVVTHGGVTSSFELNA